jgi:Flp pilus assembly protein TadB
MVSRLFQFLSHERDRVDLLVPGFRHEPSTSVPEEYHLHVSLWDRAGVRSAHIPRQLTATVLLTTVLSVVLLRSSPLFTPLAFVVPLIHYLTLVRKAYTRAEAFERDYTALLLSLASSVRAGLDPLSALIDARALFPSDSEIARELAEMESSLASGRSETDVIRQFGLTIDHPDTTLFRTVLILARSEGSSLSASLQRLAKVTRQRQSFRRRIRAAVAMQKLSSVGLIVCAVTVMGCQFVANPRLLHDSLAHPLGARSLSLGLVLLTTGSLWMICLTRSRV